MKIKVNNNCNDFNSYRSARVKSLFNCESGANFTLDAELPLEDDDWKIGVIVGPSGSGKTSIGRSIWPEVGIYDGDVGWSENKPIIDDILPKGDFDLVTGALSSVGLGSVPSWLRPYNALSNGEKFRASMARVVAECHEKVIIDEFTSVVDRQIATIGASAFSKAWKRGTGKAILLSCHYDILDWVEPDWVFDTRSGVLQRGALWRRPKFDLEIFKTNGSYWPIFEPHHYLKLPRMIAAEYYVGFVNGEAVCHIATSPRLELNAMRACRMVVMPEWQGAGVGTRFLDAICEMQFTEVNKFHARTNAVYFHTSHPGLCAALRRSKKWVQVSQMMGGGHKGKSASSNGGSRKKTASGYGGHIRAVQGFKMARQAALC
jgi:ABC-type ATPase involved in cell division